MIKPKRNDVVGLSPISGSLVHNAQGRCTPHRIPRRLTSSAEKIDLLLIDTQSQVEDLHRQMANMRLVRAQLAGCQHENGGDEGPALQIHATAIGVYADA